MTPGPPTPSSNTDRVGRLRAGARPELAGAQDDDWVAAVAAVVCEVLRSDATEVELSQPAFRLRVKRRPPARPDHPLPSTPPPRAERDLLAVRAPLAGVFFAAPSPGAAPYARVGDWLAAGDVVGLIEAMKVFNHVVTEHAGRVTRVVATDGALVAAGETLVLLDPSAPTPAEPGVPRE